MAAVVQISVDLDDSGFGKVLDDADKKVKNISNSFGQIGTSGKRAFGETTDKIHEAHQSVRLLENTLGIGMPRAMSNIIAQSTVLGPILAAAFPIAIFAAAIPLLTEIFKKIDEGSKYLGGFSKGMDEINKSNIKLNDQLLVTPKSLDNAKKTLDVLNAQISSKQKFIDSLGKEDALDRVIYGYNASITDNATKLLKLEEQRNEVIAKRGELEKAQQTLLVGLAGTAGAAGLKGIAANRAALENDLAKLKDTFNGDTDSTNYQAAVILTKLAKSRELAVEIRTMNEETAKRQNDIAAIGLTGAAAIFAKEKQELAALAIERSKTEIDETNYLNRRVQAHDRAEAEINKLIKKYSDDTARIQEEASVKGLEGFNKINQETANKLDDLKRKFDDDFGGLNKASADYAKAHALYEQQLVDTIAGGMDARTQLTRKGDQETLQVERESAAAVAPEWAKAYVQIVEDNKVRIARVNEQLQQSTINEDQARRQIEAINTISTRKIYEEHKALVEKMATNMESVFDDIANGTIGDRILKNIKHLFFQILANWILTTQQMKIGGGGIGVGGNNGGLLGGLGGLIFGGAGGGGGVGNAGTIATGGGFPPGVINNFLGGGNTPSAFGGGVAGQGGSANGTAGGGGGSLSTLPLGGGDPASGGGPLGGMIKATLGTLGGLGKKGALFGALGLGAGVLGGKLGGPLGAAGAGLAALGVLGAYNPAVLGPLAALAPALLAGTAGGLLGAGIGLQHGPVAGALTGVGAGLGTAGLMTLLGVGLGPIGWLAAGLIGLFGGLFGGFFGQSKRRKEAEQIKVQILQQINDAVTQYKSFQTDFPTTMTNLDGIDNAAKDALFKLKNEGKNEYTKAVQPALASARADLQGTETERMRRQGLMFGPPQFHEGGFVMGQGGSNFRMRNGEVMAVLKQGEYVVNERATARNRSQLESMNGGYATSNGGTQIHLHTMDPKNMAYWLRNGGAAVINDALMSGQREGR